LRSPHTTDTRSTQSVQDGAVAEGKRSKLFGKGDIIIIKVDD
jgi:hypothetical protein